ncbi:glycosyltransferase family protein [Aureimonas leprariae]|uniref:Glycosyltransferase n=1 Tax=Plantimonas leprariae TaxID=2615207 RepID=A0A7V7PQB5_9HYPH|nr:glycosyltransferase [Aureimonas leprariae]KAB0680349.1 glycosyltransferase [Aureimonas leprariae]
MSACATPRRPKLVFFQWDHQPNAAAAGYLLLHMQQHVRCLATHFDVVVVNHDSDYAEICDKHEPDLTLFESGYRSHGSKRTRIANTNARPGVPKLGLHNADPWCDRRAGFLSDMEHWGIETFFSIGTMMPAYTPQLGESLFVWPNCVDPELYRDYGQHKTIPVTLTGQVHGLYPWRQQVFPSLRERYPCLVSPQFAYESTLASLSLTGEAYARVLNASLVVPTCGTEGRELVRKHLEIPAANACLITEGTAALAAAGFVDGENCVFADRRDVVERLEHLFAHPDEMRRITQGGHALVHSRHTLRHRPQIYQWFMLNQDLGADEKIIQPGPFADLVKVDRASQRDSVHVVGSTHDRALLAQGDSFLSQGRVEDARRCYARCLDYVSYLPEARFRLALCALQSGRPDEARERLAGLIEVTTVDYGASDPDPVEWAYYLIALLCDGRFGQARGMRKFYPGLSHPELARVHSAIDWLTGGEHRSFADGRSSGHRKSVHRMPSRSDGRWFAWLAEVLESCGRPGLAARLREFPADTSVRANAPRGAKIQATMPSRTDLYAGVDRLMLVLRLSAFRPNVPPMPEFRYFRHLTRGMARALLKGRLQRVRHALAALRRPFGSYRLSGRRRGPKSSRGAIRWLPSPTDMSR